MELSCKDFAGILAIVFLFSVCRGLAAYAMGGNETDQLALLEFKAKITDDPLGVLKSWNKSIHFCQWRGVKCGRRHQRVTMLDLQSQKLVGSISPHIGNLSFLRVLQLEENGFNHEIPPEIGHLRRLQMLFLSNNSLSGEIPANLSSCSNLMYIYVGTNRLVGKIPAELGSLSKLQYLFIHANSLSGGIPRSFGNLSSLERLSATQNNIVGTIPASLFQLTTLTHVALNANGLSGTIPPSLSNLSSLIFFAVSFNHLHGNLPSNLGITLPNLQDLSLSSNRFTGSIPVSLSNASNLEYFSCNGNNLTGKVPSLEKLQRLHFFSVTSNNLGNGEIEDLGFLSSLTNISNLEVLALNVNNFGGVLPESIGNWSTKLATLLLDGNKIGGSIPAGIGNLVSLERLEMWENQLSGSIPVDIGKLQNLRMLMLIKNKLSGILPSSLGNLENLIQLVLGRNYFQGKIPSSLGKCQNLLFLDLSLNNLSGTIPPQVVNLSSLSISLDISDNRLTGALPIEVGNLKNLGVLDVSNNMLSGGIPSSIGSCTSLEYLSMKGNFFQGSIPSSFSSLRGIRILDLSHNNLSGKIPEFLQDIHFQLVNLSYNDFEGILPTEGVFKNVSATSIMGNSKLCGGIPEFQLPKCNLQEPKKRGLSLALKIIIATVSGLLAITCVLSFLIFLWLRKKKGEPASSSSEKSLLKVSYQSLLRATDGFSSSNLIGVGSFGSVYKGILDHDGTAIAVKVLNLLRKGASKSFIAECEALRNIRHRNLVKVLTACLGVDYQGNDFKAVVYEFMVNGSLEQWLHPTPTTAEASAPPRKLNFLQRLNIAIDVACALDYLHHQCQTPIVHCDLKPSNVLLDTEMTGHVGDFGIAKFLPEAATRVPEIQSSSIGIRGTIGYAAPGTLQIILSTFLNNIFTHHPNLCFCFLVPLMPFYKFFRLICSFNTYYHAQIAEYGMGSEVSTSGDVYSFGILLLEMFTGKRPTEDMFKDSLNIHNFVKTAVPERVAEIADPVLLQEGVEMDNTTSQRRMASSHDAQECLISIFGIGLACSAELPRERKNITDAAAELNSVRDILLGTRLHRRDDPQVQFTIFWKLHEKKGSNVPMFSDKLPW